MHSTAQFVAGYKAVASSITSWLNELEKTTASSEETNSLPRIQSLFDKAKEYQLKGDSSSYDKALEQVSKMIGECRTKRQNEEAEKQTACEHLEALLECFQSFVGADAINRCIKHSKQRAPEQNTASDSSSDPADSTTANSRLSVQRQPTEPVTTAKRRRRISSLSNAAASPTMTSRLSKRRNVNTSADTSTNTSPPAAMALTDTDQLKEMNFNDVYKDGEAEIKYTIHDEQFKNPITGIESRFWILRCKEHELHFANPVTLYNLKSALRHLTGGRHGGQAGSKWAVLEAFGVAVRNCSLDKAEMNNAAVSKTIENGYKAKTRVGTTGIKRALQTTINDSPATAEAAIVEVTTKTPNHLSRAETSHHGGDGGGGGGSGSSKVKKVRKHSAWDGNHDSADEDFQDNDPPYHIPVPGQLYLGYWGGEEARFDTDSEDWYAVICLPTCTDSDDFSSVGLPGASLKTVKLLEDVPDCYLYDPILQKITGWSEGYEDTGRRVSERKYPFVFIDSTEGVTLCQFAWVSVRDIKPFEDDGFDEKYRDTLLEYLASYHLCSNTPESFRRIIQTMPRRPEDSAAIEEQPNLLPESANDNTADLSGKQPVTTGSSAEMAQASSIPTGLTSQPSIKEDDSDDDEILVRGRWRSVNKPDNRATHVVISDSDSEPADPRSQSAPGPAPTPPPASAPSSASAPPSRPRSSLSGIIGTNNIPSPSARSDVGKPRVPLHKQMLRDCNVQPSTPK